jgi:hypothetical protein
MPTRKVGLDVTAADSKPDQPIKSGQASGSER